MPTATRVFNFSAGPAVLPLPVLEEAQRDLIALPRVGDVPLVSDTSSDMFSGPIDVGRHALIYSGAQKNLGPSGVTLVIIREDLLAKSADALPTMLNYRVLAENDSLYNTPNTFGIYILGLTMKWLRSQGGLDAVARVNQRKA